MNALVLVDLQIDFCPGGALPVPDGDAVLPVANRVQRHFDFVVATQDWHPPDHGSFASNHEGKRPGDVIDLYGIAQTLWPDHCIQGEMGSEFVPGLDSRKVKKVFRKGTDPTIDSYSGFYDNGHRRATGLGDWLDERGVTHVFVMGLATEYCVKYTALDSVGLGFETTVIEDGCRGVNLEPEDSARALAEMGARGVHVVRSGDL